MQVNVSVMLAKLLIGYAPSRTTDSTVDGPSSLPAVRRWTKGEGFEGVRGKQRRNRDVSISSIL